MKSDFVSMVAHEIKSPLNSVLMQLKVVMDGLAGELTEKQKEILEKSSRKIYSLTTLASELLDLSKIESGLINQDREELDIIELIRNQAEFYRDKAVSKGIDIDVQVTRKEIFMMGNRTNIEELVSNLISNAIRYSPDGGRIVVRADENKDRVKIVVSDTGLGIPEDEIAHIFDRFFRVKNEKTRHINGTGLGLAIVKSIVEAHHGSIKVESELGKGTSFSVYFPILEYKL
jgi:signal transduction histidine kinase